MSIADIEFESLGDRLIHDLIEHKQKGEIHCSNRGGKYPSMHEGLSSPGSSCEDYSAQIKLYRFG